MGQEQERTPRIASVSLVHSSDRSPQPQLSLLELQTALRERGLGSLVLNELLHGGYMSQVYGGVNEGVPVVIKHSEDTLPFDPTCFFISKAIQNTEAEVLRRLMSSTHVRVPKLVKHFPDITTTVMEDLRIEKYALLSIMISQGILPMEAAWPIGLALASLVKETSTWDSFKTDQTALLNIYDRGLELRMAYPNKQQQYLELEQRFTQQNQGWVWVDGTPKNVMVTPAGHPAFIDFGLSCFGDQQQTLPNFLSHIAVYGLAGIIDKNKTSEFIRTCVQSYAEAGQIDEKSFCQYFGMEMLHRAMGKRIPGIENREQKLALMECGLRIFDENVITVTQLLEVIDRK